MSAPSSELLRAVDLALSGDWEAAHEIVQQHEDDTTAAWIHAVLHKIEGDLGNAQYWYRRANRAFTRDDPNAEFQAIRAGLKAEGSEAGRGRDARP